MLIDAADSYQPHPLMWLDPLQGLQIVATAPDLKPLHLPCQKLRVVEFVIAQNSPNPDARKAACLTHFKF